MNTNWRPEGWKNPYSEHEINGAQQTFEWGADAMLRALQQLSNGKWVRFDKDGSILMEQ